MKKTFSRFLALIVALVMLVSMSMTTLAETYTEKHTEHVLLNLMGQVFEQFNIETVDEDGCMHIESITSELGQISSVLAQINDQAITLSVNGEAYTITAEEVMKAVEMVEALAPDLLAQVIDPDMLAAFAMGYMMGQAVAEYMQSPEAQNDMAIVANVLMNEVNRVAMIASQLGYVVMTDAGEIYIELDNVKILTLIANYLEQLSADESIFQALASLTLWNVIGVSEQVAQIVSMAPATLMELADELNSEIAYADVTMNLSVAIAQTGMTLAFSAQDYSDTVTLNVTADVNGVTLNLYAKDYSTVATLDMAANANGVTLSYASDYWDGYEVTTLNLVETADSMTCDYSYTHSGDTVTANIAATNAGLTVNVAANDGWEDYRVAAELSNALHVNFVETGYYDTNEIDFFFDPMSGVSFIVNAKDSNGEVYGNITFIVNENGLQASYLNNSSKNYNTALNFVVDNSGIVLTFKDVEYSIVTTVDASYDPMTNTTSVQYLKTAYDKVRESYTSVSNDNMITVTGMNDDGLTYNCNVMMAGSTAMIQTTANADNLTINGTGSIVNGVLNYDATIVSYDIPGTLHVTSDGLNTAGSLSVQGTTYDASCAIDPNSLYASVIVDVTMDGQTVNMLSAVATPVMTEDTIAYNVNATVSGQTLLDATVGLTQYDSTNSIHGEAFADVNGQNGSVEFNVVPDGSFVELTAKVAGQALAYLLVENEITFEVAPAHVEGAVITAEQMIELVMNLLSSVM